MDIEDELAYYPVSLETSKNKAGTSRGRARLHFSSNLSQSDGVESHSLLIKEALGISMPILAGGFRGWLPLEEV